MDVEAWLRRLGMGQYAGAFARNHIDAETLGKLTGQDLKEIGVASVGHRRRLLAAIEQLTPETPAPGSAPEAERRQLTVMFCDLVGSTALAERLDPEDMRELIRAYQDCVTVEVERLDGKIAKFMGDGVLAYFGWPQAHEDDAERAVRSGLGIAGAVGRIAAPTGDRLQVRVGIATGLVVVGDLIGEGSAREEAVVGDTPNLAARLQGLARGNAVVVAENTRALLGEHFAYEDLGPQMLRGFSNPMQVWRVLRPLEAVSRFEATRGPHLTPLVGRDEQLERLLRRWAKAKAGEGQVVLLTGEPGIGKSRITHALRAHIAEEPHGTMLYQCSPYHTNSAFYPFIQQLERAAGFEHGDTEDGKLEKLNAMLGQSGNARPESTTLLAALLSLPVEGRDPALTMSPQEQKEETLRALLERLEALAARRAVLLIFEDLHWVDPTSQELLELIVARVKALPVLVLVTFRPEYQPPWPARGHVSLLALKRLDAELGAAMIRALSGGKALPQEVLAQIVMRADGIPLFVEELTRTVLDSGLLQLERDRYVVAGGLPPHAIPTSLKDSLMARLDRLASVKEVAQIGAVIGREFSRQLLAQVSDLSDEDLEDALERLRGAELLFRKGETPNASYLFKHALVRDAAYESLLKGRRRHLHARIARLLDDGLPDQRAVEPEVLAHHYTEASLPERAATHWQRAGERAVAQSAHVEAISHLKKGLTVLTALPESPECRRLELGLQAALGPPLAATQGYGASEVGQVYGRAQALCREVGDTAQLCSILYGLWAFHGTRAEYDKNRALADELLSSAERTRDPLLVLDGHVARAATSFFLGEFEPARAHGARGMAIYDPSRHRRHALQNPGVNCEIYHAAAHWFLGYPAQALAKARAMLDHARRLAHPFSLAGVLTWMALLHHCIRKAEDAQAFAEEAMAISDDRGFPSWLSVACWVRGWAMAEQGRTQEGVAQVQAGFAIRESEGARLWRPYQLSLLAEAQRTAGRLEEAQRLLGEALGTAETTGERYWEAELHRLQGELLLSGPASDPAEAEACFARALEVARRQRAKALELRAAMSLGRLWQRQDRTAEARGLLAPIHGWFTEGFDTPDLMDAKRLLEELS